jgi:hypothetical protein
MAMETTNGSALWRASILDSANRRWENFTNENSSLGAKAVQDIIGDNDGNMWFALFDAKGVSRLNRNRSWSTLKRPAACRAILFLPLPQTWPDVYGLGRITAALKFSGNNWIKHALEACEYLPAVTDFLRADSAVWVASQCGIFKLSPDLSVTCRIAKNRPQEFPSNDVRAIAVRNDTLWAGTHRDGLARVLGCNTAAKLDTIFLRDRQITALAYNRHGQLWAGTNNGLYLFDGTAFLQTLFMVLIRGSHQPPSHETRPM